ncbi:hypothetical protein [Nibricoccus sp. IMCC34717]|uniref:hypothetical protein n=1 Tax=Nibricoccus sp. IMCC34717 TaxID=3034021 RepID=UPI00384EB26D
MARPSLTTEVFVLGTHPPAEKFARLDAFSADHGTLLAYQRLSRRTATLDLFDRATVELDAAPQGEAWFVRDASVTERQEGIARSFEALRCASLFARCITANPVPAESRRQMFDLIGQALRSFASGIRPDITLFKSLFVFARDEGLPVRQQWLATLSRNDQERAQELLTKPVREQQLPPAEVSALLRKLCDYLVNESELRLPGSETF